MKIREGAYYRTRGGYVVGPMEINLDDPDRPWCDQTGMAWPDDGKYNPEYDGATIDFGDGLDLISEVYVSDTPHADAPAPEAKSLRDEFAIAALQGLLARYDFHARDVARDAYEYADAMTEARKK